MKAAERFIHRWLLDPGRLPEVARIRADVYGSLALTGRGHGTDKAILLGLEGQRPNLIDPDIIPATLERIRSSKRIQLMGQHEIAFDEKRDLGMNKRQKLPYHTNGMRFTAYNAEDEVIATRDYYSVGGGFVVNQTTRPTTGSCPMRPRCPTVQERRRAAGADRTQRPEHCPADVREREVLAQ